MSTLDICFSRSGGNTVSEEIWIFDTAPFQNYSSDSFGSFLMLLLEALDPSCNAQAAHENRDELIAYFKKCFERYPSIVVPLQNIKGFLALCSKDESLCNTDYLNMFWTMLKHEIPSCSHTMDYSRLNIYEFADLRHYFTLGNIRFSDEKLREAVGFINSDRANRLFISDTFHCNDLVDLCYAYLYQLFTAGHIIRYCANCGKPFISKKGEEYCSRTSPQDKEKLCCEMAISEQPQEELSDMEQTAEQQEALGDNEIEAAACSEIAGNADDMPENEIGEAEIGKTDDTAEAETVEADADDKSESDTADTAEADASADDSCADKEAPETDAPALDETAEKADIKETADESEKTAEESPSQDSRAESSSAVQSTPSQAVKVRRQTGQPKSAPKSGAARREELNKLHRQIYMRKQMLVKRNPDNQNYADAFAQYKADTKQWKQMIKSSEKTVRDYYDWLSRTK